MFVEKKSWYFKALFLTFHLLNAVICLKYAIFAAQKPLINAAI